MNANERIMWPLEAKILEKDKSIGEYTKDLTEDYLTCRYAPFSDSGAMVGYLLSGDPLTTFSAISEKIGIELRVHEDFTDRNHRISFHCRKVPESKPYPQIFFCHHLIMKMK